MKTKTDLSNKNTLNTLRAAIKDALEKVEFKHGVDIKIGNITYEADGTEFRTKMTCRTSNAEPTEVVAFRREAKSCAERRWGDFYTHGITEDHILRDYRIPQGSRLPGSPGGTFKLVGYKPRARKNNMIVECENGTRRAMPISMLSEWVHISEGTLGSRPMDKNKAS